MATLSAAEAAAEHTDHADHRADPGRPPRVVLATASSELRTEVARLAAGAGCELETCADLSELRRVWQHGAALMLGHDLLEPLRGSGLPRRAGIHVLAPAPLTAEQLRDAMALGAGDVLELPQDAARAAAMLGDLADARAGAGMVVGVVGGSGGVGASVLTVALATVAAEHTTALAVDLDPLGAGLEHLAAPAPSRAPVWDSLVTAQGRLGGSALRSALALPDGPGILGWGGSGQRPMPHPALVAESLDASRRGHEWTFVDSRSPGVWSSCDALVVVAAGSVHAVAAALRVAARIPTGVPVGLAVRSRRRDRWADQVSRSLGLPVWAVLTQQRALDDHLSAGLGPVRGRRSPVRVAATDILREVSAR